VFFKKEFCSSAAAIDEFRGDRSLYSGTLPGRGSAPGAISIDSIDSIAVSIDSTAVSIDSTAISIDVAIFHDEEGVVLPRG
jgi:hypothetical protein